MEHLFIFFVKKNLRKKSCIYFLTKLGCLPFRCPMSASSVSKDFLPLLTFPFSCLSEKRHIVQQIISEPYAKNCDFTLKNLKDKIPQPKTSIPSSSERSIAEIFSEVIGQTNPQRKRRETRELFNELLEKNRNDLAL
ncbi:MAG TPA: hypothetical protein DCE71_07050 [Parachlamydiales bacterium]|nr:hypothetical protein [Parachlamydiales bacterium]